jgi:hypothetical protein
MVQQSNRLVVQVMGLVDGVAEGPLAIAAFVLIVLAMLITYSIVRLKSRPSPQL